MSDECLIERDGPILTVTLNRPEQLNALNPTLHRRLEATWDAFFADPELQVAILTGAGPKAFCAGSDLSSWNDTELPYSVAAGYAGLTHRLDCPKPIIAAVNGIAFGGGFETVLCCDLAVASENALFSLPEPLVGAAAMGGGIPRLCRKLPHNRAMTLLLTGERMTAAEALRWGLLSEVVPQGEVLSAARALARRILKCSPVAIRATKMVADAVLRGDSMADVLAFEQGEPTRMFRQSEDLREGVAAFFGKRAPVWQGR